MSITISHLIQVALSVISRTAIRTHGMREVVVMLLLVLVYHLIAQCAMAYTMVGLHVLSIVLYEVYQLLETR